MHYTQSITIWTQFKPYSLTENQRSKRIDTVTYSKHLTTVLTHIWERWRTEYLSELRELHKCTKKSVSANFNVNKNDIVIVQDSNIPRLLWRLGIVENVIISKNNQVRGAKVRLSNSQILERPVNMLYPIEATKLTETSVHNPIYEENVDFVLATV